MKNVTLLIAVGLLAACSSPTDEQARQAKVATPTAAAAPAGQPATSASTTGLVTAVDADAKTITIAHKPVPELQWPAMTMTFQAPDVDLSVIKPGDQVSFEFTSTGMNGTVTSLTRH